MRQFPIFLDLRNRIVLVVGEGEAADRKAASLAETGALIRRDAAFRPELLADCVLAIGADTPDDQLRALSAAAQACHIPVNIVDRPALCSFYSPAIVDRAPLLVAIGSGGAAPVLARLVRARIEALLPANLGDLVRFAARHRDEIRRRLPALPRRRALLEALFGGRIADLVLAGATAQAESALAAALDQADQQAAGMVYLLGAGPGDADLITLRAQRLLGEADIVVHDELPPELLALARRDAVRQPATDTAQLVALAQAGRKVVWLHHGVAPAACLAALTEAGIVWQIVPGLPAD
jgi:uroporphyrin-III C-methyltransferase/precorrin-2 dehydrogenase/sirohydrochlorin ferrochelatase